jgi:hypothetical protein
MAVAYLRLATIDGGQPPAKIASAAPTMGDGATPLLRLQLHPASRAALVGRHGSAARCRMLPVFFLAGVRPPPVLPTISGSPPLPRPPMATGGAASSTAEQLGRHGLDLVNCRRC